jgi:hypothetical protein
VGRARRRRRGEPGGIDGLILLIEEHRAAFDYDWWTRFGKPVRVIGKSMTWGEAVRLVRLLRADPGSQIATALEGWEYPFPRSEAMAADLWDLEHAKAGAKKRATYPRPYGAPQTKVQRGNAAGRTPDEVKTILRTRFGQPAPV